MRFAIAVFLLASIVIGWPWLSGQVTIPWDAKAQFQPQIQFLAQSLARGESPFWAPFVFSGVPQVADPQSMIFSPPFLALAALDGSPSLWSADATVLAMVALGGVALMLWFRDQGWHWAGGLVAALAFCHGAAMAWRIQHIGQVLSLAYLPFALFLIDRALKRRSIWYGATAGLVAGIIVLGRDQVALLGLYLLAGFAIWRLAQSAHPMRALRLNLLPILVGGVVALAVIAIPVTLTAALAAESNRAVIDYPGAARGSLHPALLLTAVLPDLFGASGRMEDYWGPPSFAWQGTDLFIAQNMGILYIGAIPLLLIAVAALRGRLWEPQVRFFTVAAVAMLFYALGRTTPVFRVIYELFPGVKLYRRPADAVFLIGALGAILAGYSAHRLFQQPTAPLTRRHVMWVLGGIGAAFEIAILLGFWLDRASLLWTPLAAGAMSFGLCALVLVLARGNIQAKPMLAASLLAAALTVDLAINNGPNSATAQPPAVYDVLEPSTRNATIGILKSKAVDNETRRDRIELAGLGFHWPNVSLTHRLENTLGYNPVRSELYSAATGAEDHVGLPDQRKFAPLFPSYRSTLADMLGLRFIATGVPVEQIDPKLKPGDLTLIARTADGYVYENPRAMDRVAFATSARTADFDRLLKDGAWPDVDFATTVLLQRADPAGATPRRPGRARILDYRNTEVQIDADSPDGGWLVLHDLWHPWWSADIDGTPTEILRANVLFRAIAVPPGRHKITFRFRPVAGALTFLMNSMAAFHHRP